MGKQPSTPAEEHSMTETPDEPNPGSPTEPDDPGGPPQPPGEDDPDSGEDPNLVSDGGMDEAPQSA